MRIARFQLFGVIWDMCMKNNIYLFAAALLFSCKSFAGEIVGTWRVDLDRTIWFNSRVVKHTGLAIKLLQCAGENEKLLVSQKKIEHVITAHSCKFEDKEGEIEGVSNSYSYKQIYSSDNELVILKSADSTQEIVQVMHWVNKNMFWIDEIYDDETQKEMRYFFYREE